MGFSENRTNMKFGIRKHILCILCPNFLFWAQLYILGVILVDFVWPPTRYRVAGDLKVGENEVQIWKKNSFFGKKSLGLRENFKNELDSNSLHFFTPDSKFWSAEFKSG